MFQSFNVEGQGHNNIRPPGNEYLIYTAKSSVAVFGCSLAQYNKLKSTAVSHISGLAMKLKY